MIHDNKKRIRTSANQLEEYQKSSILGEMAESENLRLSRFLIFYTSNKRKIEDPA
jgi:hypothetical protein